MVSIPTAVHTSGIAQAPVVKFEEHASTHTSDKVLRLLGCTKVKTKVQPDVNPNSF